MSKSKVTSCAPNNNYVDEQQPLTPINIRAKYDTDVVIPHYDLINVYFNKEYVRFSGFVLSDEEREKLDKYKASSSKKPYSIKPQCIFQISPTVAMQLMCIIGNLGDNTGFYDSLNESEIMFFRDQAKALVDLLESKLDTEKEEDHAEK